MLASLRDRVHETESSFNKPNYVLDPAGEGEFFFHSIFCIFACFKYTMCRPGINRQGSIPVILLRQFFNQLFPLRKLSIYGFVITAVYVGYVLLSSSNKSRSNVYRNYNYIELYFNEQRIN